VVREIGATAAKNMELRLPTANPEGEFEVADAALARQKAAVIACANASYAERGASTAGGARSGRCRVGYPLAFTGHLLQS
jgi:hypothetical protein